MTMSLPKRRRRKLKKTGINLPSRRWTTLFVAAVLCVSLGFSQSKKKDDQDGRTVQGVVSAPDDSPIVGAVVYLKNTKTLQVRSFITQQNGLYFFHGLSSDVDYELRAENKGASSPTKTLSSFDSRKAANLDLKIKK
jgi:Carboxypeptidase regulatory-like domain